MRIWIFYLDYYFLLNKLKIKTLFVFHSDSLA